MKTLRTILFGLVALVVIVAAVTFFLPAKVSMERSTNIDRPPSLVYAFVADINGFNQFSPWKAADPAMTANVTGQAGPGQKMVWDSKKMGKGSMTLVDAKPYDSVSYDLDFGGSKAKASFKLQPTETGSKVTWGFESQAGFNPIERVMNLVMKGFVAKDYDAGLAKLRVLAESLPNVDLNGLTTSTVDLTSKPFIFVPVETSDADMTAARTEILRGMNKANAVLILNDLNPAGPGIIQYKENANGLIKANAGFPMEKAPTLEEAAALVGSAKVVFGEIPGGKMLRAHSPAGGADKTFKQLQVYLKLMRLKSNGEAQEFFPAGPNGDTEIFVPIS